MKKIKFIGIVVFICFITLSISACGRKDKKKDSSVGSNHVEKGKETEETDINEEQNIESENETDSEEVSNDSYENLFVQDNNNSNNNSNNSNSNDYGDGSKIEETTSPDKDEEKDDLTEEPDNGNIHTEKDTETGYGAISGGTGN